MVIILSACISVCLMTGKEGKRNLVVCDAQGRQFMVFPANVRWVVPGSGYRVNDVEVSKDIHRPRGAVSSCCSQVQNM